MHKVIHLMVGTFEQGLETSPAECPLVECGQSNSATGALYRKDRSSQSDRMLVAQCSDAGVLRPVSSSSEHASRSCDRTLVGCVWSVLTYVDVRRTEETLCDRTLGESGRA